MSKELRAPEGPDNSEYISIEGVQNKLSVSRSFVYTMIKEGLPSYKVLGAVRFKVSDVDQFMDSRRTIQHPE